MQILLQNGFKIVKKSPGAAPRTRQTPARYGVCPRGAPVRMYGHMTISHRYRGPPGTREQEDVKELHSTLSVYHT